MPTNWLTDYADVPAKYQWIPSQDPRLKMIEMYVVAGSSISIWILRWTMRSTCRFCREGWILVECCMHVVLLWHIRTGSVQIFSSLANNLVLYVLLICVMIYDFWIGEMGIRPVRLVNLVVLDTNKGQEKRYCLDVASWRCVGGRCPSLNLEPWTLNY